MPDDGPAGDWANISKLVLYQLEQHDDKIKDIDERLRALNLEHTAIQPCVGEIKTVDGKHQCNYDELRKRMNKSDTITKIIVAVGSLAIVASKVF